MTTYDVNEAAATFWADRLTRTANAVEYLRTHGLSQLPPMWRIGYAPNGWKVLTTHLLNTGFSEDDIVDAGVAFRHKDTGDLLDRFRGRLMFPITDVDNRTIAFTARDLTGQSTSRWINTPGSPVYRKSSVLYGLGQQLAHPPAGSGEPTVFVVEGATDVIATHLMDLPRHLGRPVYTVAPCGTGFTSHHLNLLRQTLPDAHLVLALDGDTAGRRAASRTYPLAKTWPAKVSGTVLPADHDPADLLATSGPDEAAAVLLQSVQPLARIELANRIDALLHDGRITDPATYPADRDRVCAAIAPLFVDDPRDIDELSATAAARLGVDPTTVIQGIVDVLEARTGSPPGPDPPPAAPAPSPEAAPAPTRSPGRRRAERATVTGSAHHRGPAATTDITLINRSDPGTGRTVWALADGIGTYPEAAVASVMAAEIAATVALRTTPPAGLNAARHALNGHYANTHASQTGDASLLVVTAYPEPNHRHGVRFELAWTGDCHAYTIHKGHLTRITTAQDPGDLVLSSSVRGGDISVCPLDTGPLLLCTNALPRQVPDKVLAFELAGTSDARRTARRLATAVTDAEVGIVVIHATNAPPHRVTTTPGTPRQVPTATGPAPAMVRSSFAPITTPLSTDPLAVHSHTDAQTPRVPKRR
ncbi:hypothetical protein GCM10009557_15480 [Virgisporangium ochraceum]|uniref:Toprim domain-containing protein n=1 Tax=Virgisporangium ochraceum TaxID=65505 RepID=A0A8J3ZRY8_9ACTN|nr:toprim domain-containing protein [Virgisporangium ochraceum]GIJ67942.1 hypothetical protein Voc01_028590 [Virgisporangium ochraceum]